MPLSERKKKVVIVKVVQVGEAVRDMKVDNYGFSKCNVTVGFITYPEGQSSGVITHMWRDFVPPRKEVWS